MHATYMTMANKKRGLEEQRFQVSVNDDCLIVER